MMTALLAILVVYLIFWFIGGGLLFLSCDDGDVEFIGYDLCVRAGEANDRIDNLIDVIENSSTYMPGTVDKTDSQLRTELAETVKIRRVSFVFGALCWLFWPFVLLYAAVFRVCSVFINIGNRGKKIRDLTKNAGPQDKVG